MSNVDTPMTAHDQEEEDVEVCPGCTRPIDYPNDGAIVRPTARGSRTTCRTWHLGCFLN